jgi:histidinol-phosphatase
MLLAEGALDIMVEPELSLWDVAALIPIVTEAGGTITDLAGRPPGDKTPAIATNGPLHETILNALVAPKR